MVRGKTILLLMLLQLWLSSNVLAQTDAQQELQAGESAAAQADERDPFESFNRAMWQFNYGFLEPVVVRPTVHAYDDYVPELMKDSFGSFFDNLDSPFSAVNHLLQGKAKPAGIELLRFTINSTVGIIGLFDVASDMGLPAHQKEEFGEVMHQVGIKQGPYLMLPFFGPTSVRDESGDFIDRLYFPYTLLNPWQNVGRWALDSLNDRARLRDQEALLDNALDPYAFTKDAYFQLLEYDVYDGQIPASEEDSELWLDEYLDEIDQ